MGYEPVCTNGHNQTVPRRDRTAQINHVGTWRGPTTNVYNWWGFGPRNRPSIRSADLLSQPGGRCTRHIQSCSDDQWCIDAVKSMCMETIESLEAEPPERLPFTLTQCGFQRQRFGHMAMNC